MHNDTRFLGNDFVLLRTIILEFSIDKLEEVPQSNIAYHLCSYLLGLVCLL